MYSRRQHAGKRRPDSHSLHILFPFIYGNNISQSRLFRKTCTRKTDTYHRKRSIVPFVLRMVRTPFSTLTAMWSAGSPATVTESFAFASSSARP